MIQRSVIIGAALILAGFAAQAPADTPLDLPVSARDIVLVVERTDLDHFVRMLEGCQERARATSLRCRLATPQEVIEQTEPLSNPARTVGLGIAIAAPLPPRLAAALGSIDAPKIAVDVDVKPLAVRSFVGTNNRDIGRALGAAVQRLKPNGATVAVITDQPDRGAAHERWLGVVDHLGPAWPVLDSAPHPSGGDPEVAARFASTALTPAGEPPMAPASVLVSLGPWPMLATEAWATLVQSLRPALDRRETVILAADASDTQIRQLRESKTHALVAAPAGRLGQATAQALIEIARGRRVPDIIYVGIDIVTRDSIVAAEPPR